MPAFNLEHERLRITELSDRDKKMTSVRDSLESYILERTEQPSPFELRVEPSAIESIVTADGYEHREDGDLMNSFEKSEEEAETSVIQRRYNLENQGYELASKYFGSLPLYSTVMLASPAPDDSIPGYPGHNMLYFYHIMPGSSEDTRTIKALSWVNRFTKEEQSNLLNSFLGKQVDEELEGEETSEREVHPTEKSILLHPVAEYSQSEQTEDGRNTESFRTLWKAIGNIYKKDSHRDFAYPSVETMERYLLYGKHIWAEYHPDLAEMRDRLTERIVAGESVRTLDEDWKIFLNVADAKLRHKDVSALLTHASSAENLRTLSVEQNRGAEIVVFDFYRDKYAGNARETETSCGYDSGSLDSQNALRNMRYGGDFAGSLRAGLASFGGGSYDIVTGQFEIKINKTKDSSSTGSDGKRYLECKSCPMCGYSGEQGRGFKAKIEGGRIHCPSEKKCNAAYAC